jgi:hypothetical protein
MAYKIFLCYRRDDKEFARGIERRLVQEFGADAVFLDVESVRGGRDWKRSVVKALEDDPIVVTLITTKWNSIRGGQRKLFNKADHIRFELQTALGRELPIIPVLYEPARWPKADQLPPTLKSILRFQKVPFSYERWDYDAGELVRALRDVLGEPHDVQTEERPQVAAHQPIPSRLRSAYSPLPTTFDRRMFQESPEERKAREDAAKAERERIERARTEATPFYARWEFWVAALVTLVLGAAALVGAEALAQVIASNWISLPDPSLAAGVLLVVIWAITRMGLSAAAYWYDPERGSSVFYTRGLLGGYTLMFADYEPVGMWAAFPIATAAAWMVARGIAWVPNNFWEWNYGLIFWLVLLAYTVPVFALYSLFTLEETVDF